MGKGSSGSTNTTTTSSQPPPQVLAAYQTAIDRASGAANAPYQPYQGNIVAPFSDLQTQAFQNAYAPSDAYNSTAPYAADYYQRGAAGLQGGVGIAGNAYQAAMGQYGYATDPYAAAARIAGDTYQGAGGAYQNAVNTANAYGGAAGGIYGQAAGQYGSAQNPLDQASGIAGGMYGAAPNALGAAAGQAQGTWGQAAGAYGASNAPLWANTQQYNPSTLSQYFNPYLQNVVNATQAQFTNQNAIQQQQVIGNAAAQGAWGGDRSAVAQALLAGQQQTAQAPVLAGLYNQGFQQAQQELNTQQAAQLGANEAQGWLASQTGAGLAGIGSAQANLGQAQTQAQMQAAQGIAGLGQAQTAARLQGAQGLAGIGGQYGQLGQMLGQMYGQQGAGMAGVAQGVGNLGQGLTQAQLAQAQGMAGIGQGVGNLSNQQAQTYAGLGAGMGQLGVQGANVGLSQLNTLQSLGAQQQQLQQAQLNVPYQQYIAAQAYPFQTSQFYTNAAEGLGGLAGGTSQTTSPGPSPISGIGGLLGGAASLAGLFVNRGGRIDGYGVGGKIDPIHGSLPHNPDIGAKPMRIGVYNIPHRLKMASGGLAGTAASQKQQQQQLGIPDLNIPDLSLSIVPVPTSMDRTGLHLGPPTPPTVPSTTAPNATSTLGTELGGLMKNDAFTNLFKKSSGDYGGGDYGGGGSNSFNTYTGDYGGGGDFGAAYSDPGFYERGGIIGRSIPHFDTGGDPTADDTPPQVDPDLHRPVFQPGIAGRDPHANIFPTQGDPESIARADPRTNPREWMTKMPSERIPAAASGFDAPVNRDTSAPTLVGIKPEVMKFVGQESDYQPYVGYTSPATFKAQGHATDLKDAPLTPTGRPDWAGDKGPKGNSTAFGPAGITGENWDKIAPRLGVTDWREPGAYAKVVNALHDAAGDAPWTTQAGVAPARGGLHRMQLAQYQPRGESTVTSDAPSGIAGHVPAAVAAEPEKLSGWKKMEAAGVNPWLMLAQGFFGAAAGRSPQAFQNFGAGFADATKTAIELMGPKSQLERAQTQQALLEVEGMRAFRDDQRRGSGVDAGVRTLDQTINGAAKSLGKTVPTQVADVNAAPGAVSPATDTTGGVDSPQPAAAASSQMPPPLPQEVEQHNLVQQNIASVDAQISQLENSKRYASRTAEVISINNQIANLRIRQSQMITEDPLYKRTIEGGGAAAKVPFTKYEARPGAAVGYGKEAPFLVVPQDVDTYNKDTGMYERQYRAPNLGQAGQQQPNPNLGVGVPNLGQPQTGAPPPTPPAGNPYGAAVVIKPGPEQEAQLKEMGEGSEKANQKFRTETLENAQSAQTNNTNLAVMAENAKNFYTGVGSDFVGDLTKLGSIWFPTLTDPAAQRESFNKTGGTLIRTATRELSPRAAFQEVQFVQKNMPNQDMTPRGLQLVISEFQGMNDYSLAKAKALQDWQMDHGGTGHVAGFEDNWQAKAPVTPYTFVLARMPKADLQGVVDRMSQTEEGRKVIQQLRKQADYAKEHGML